ncbi:MAG: hypothetical protein HYY37_00905 [Candidatus Aenigmarchaeota archaeon]|nr:hypothetical protein [Candidatus Aenigmarchaeota archaeon]
MSFFFGLLAAFLSAVLWGSMFVLLKKEKSTDMLQFHAFMGVGIALSTLLLIPAFGLAFTLSIAGFFAGLLWSAGNILSVFAIRDIGLAKAPPIWMSIVMIMNFAWGTLFFREHLVLLFGILGIAALVLGATVVSLAKDDRASLHFKGIALAAVSGVMYGGIGALFKYYNMSNGELLFSMAAGILVSGVAIFALKFRRLEMNALPAGIAAGTMWNVASLSSLYAIAFLGLAVSMPLTQLALLVSALWGLFYFREAKGKTKRKILAGALVMLAGGVLLALSKLMTGS